MKRKPSKYNVKNIILTILIVLFTLFVLINIFWTIYAFVKYWGKPVSEVPIWALWYMFSGGK